VHADNNGVDDESQHDDGGGSARPAPNLMSRTKMSVERRRETGEAMGISRKKRN
jgi:hypothetical protein